MNGQIIQTDFIDQYQSPVVDRHRQAHKSRGRIVGQIASVLPAEGTVNVADWPKCKTIGLVDSLRKVGDDESNFERRYYISSRELTAEQLAVAVRPVAGDAAEVLLTLGLLGTGMLAVPVLMGLCVALLKKQEV